MTASRALGDVIDVLVVDDHRAFADAISLAIDVQPDLVCRGAVSTAEEALDVVERSCPSVVLLDLGLPGMGGIEAIHFLHEACPSLRVLVLTADTSAASFLASAEAGADGFLPKEQPFADVLDAIRSDDLLTVDAITIDAVLNVAAQDAALLVDVGIAPELTDREHEILLLLAEAQPVKMIARLLGISVNTCRGHVRTLLAKFDAHSQLEAVVRAARLGMLPHLHAHG